MICGRMSQSTIFMCVHLYFTVFGASYCGKKTQENLIKCKIMQKQIFLIGFLACLYLLLVHYEAWSLINCRADSRVVTLPPPLLPCWPPLFLNACWALMSSFRVVNMSAFTETALPQKKKRTFYILKSSFLESIFHFVFMHVPLYVIKHWNDCPESLLRLTPVLLCSAPPLMTTGKCWLPPNPAPISDRSWQVWPPSHMWVRLQALLESYEWPLQTHARWNELPEEGGTPALISQTGKEMTDAIYQFKAC